MPDPFSPPLPKRGKGKVVAAAGALLGLAVGVPALVVRVQDPNATSYAACHRDVGVWFGCLTGLFPLLPWALVAGGALTLFLIFRLGRRNR